MSAVEHETELVATWDPYEPHPDDFFDELYAKLKPECEAIDRALRGFAQRADPDGAPLSRTRRLHVAERAGGDRVCCSSCRWRSSSRRSRSTRCSTASRSASTCCRCAAISRASSTAPKTIMAYFRERLGVGHLETTDDGLFSYEEVECLAACDRAPCMQVNLRFKYDLTPQMIDDMLVGDARRHLRRRRRCPQTQGAGTARGRSKPKPAASRPAASASRIPTTPAASAIAAA